MTNIELLKLQENYNAERNKHLNELFGTEQKSDPNIQDILENDIKRSEFESKRNKFKNGLKDTFLFEAFYTVFDKAMARSGHVFTKPLMRALVKNYIAESGADNLLSKMHTKTLFLSEVSRLVNKYSTNVMLEANEATTEDELIISDDTKKSFYEELDKTEIDDISSEIKSRVSDAMGDFIEENNNRKAEIEKIIDDNNRIKENIQADTDEEETELKESYDFIAQRKIRKIKSSNKSVVSHFIEAVAVATMKDPKLLSEASIDGQLDMDKVIDKAGTMYTFLEMLNTTKLENVNADYLKEILEDI